jgi:hypothetical protein
MLIAARLPQRAADRGFGAMFPIRKTTNGYLSRRDVVEAAVVYS